MNSTTEIYSGNSTLNESDNFYPPKILQTQFIVAVSIEVGVIVTTIWFGLAMVCYGIRKNEFKKVSCGNFGGFIYPVAFLSTVAMLGRACSSILLITVPTYLPGYDDECERLNDSTNCFYLVVILCVYGVLWLRQKALYAIPTMVNVYSKFVIALSWSSIVFLVTGGIAALLFVTLPKSTKSWYYGCTIRAVTGSTLAATAFSVTGQLMLLILFIIPLREYMQRPKFAQSFQQRMANFYRRSSASESADPKSEVQEAISPPSSPKETISRPLSSKKLKNKKIFALLKRLIAIATICIVSDIIAMTLATQFVKYNIPMNFSILCYDLNLLLNVICIILTFESRKQIIIPCCRGNTDE